ncbi:MAG TPA: TIGR02266 family protein [Myxococcaceae bacterium]|nr:TIGR02266 family protein [Myxococcaceae bacterium]
MEDDEKRGDPRLPFVLRVHFRDRAEALSATENLSRGGLFVQTRAALGPGDPVALAVSFPGLLEPVPLQGEVVWVRVPRPDAVGGLGIRVADPAARARLQAVLAEGAPPRPAASPAGYRVLLVEDNPHVLEMVSYVLKKLANQELGGRVPLEVHFAQDGHGALVQLERLRFDLVVTDLYMPVLDGFQLLQRMKSDPRTRAIPVVAISGGGTEAQVRATDFGVDVYLGKPLKFVQVLETVKQLLRIS